MHDFHAPITSTHVSWSRCFQPFIVLFVVVLCAPLQAGGRFGGVGASYNTASATCQLGSGVAFHGGGGQPLHR
jgi:hypothetical protein